MAKNKGVGGRGSEVKAPPKGSGAPPSVKARDVTRAGKPPPEKYAGKKKPPRMGWGGGVPDMPDWGSPKKPPKGIPIYPKPKPRPKKPGVPIFPKPKPRPKKPGPNIVKPMKKKAGKKKTRKK